MSTNTLTHRPDAPKASESLEVIEAPTAEAALARVHDYYGPDADIMQARKTLRGGIGGFFAREIVELHVRPTAPRSVAPTAGTASIASASTRPDPLFAGKPMAAAPTTTDTSTPFRTASPVDRLVGQADFADVLRDKLRAAVADHHRETQPHHELQAAVMDGSVQPVADARIQQPRSRVRGGPAWSATTLVRIGLPASFVHDLGVSDIADDIEWTQAVATAVGPLCRPLPHGRSLLVGPKALPFGQQLGIPVGHNHEFCAALQQRRWTHLVVGGQGWRDGLQYDPLAVSWATVRDLPTALQCALDLGLVLGYGPTARGIERAQPLDVALRIRALVRHFGDVA